MWDGCVVMFAADEHNNIFAIQFFLVCRVFFFSSFSSDFCGYAMLQSHLVYMLPNQFDFYRRFFHIAELNRNTHIYKVWMPTPNGLKQRRRRWRRQQQQAAFLCLYLNVLWKHNFHSYLIGSKCCLCCLHTEFIQNDI